MRQQMQQWRQQRRQLRSGLGELVVIEPDEGENESHDEDAYAAFEESIEVEDHEASYLEAL